LTKAKTRSKRATEGIDGHNQAEGVSGQSKPVAHDTELEREGNSGKEPITLLASSQMNSECKS